jgi:Tir chaperone family protein CesT
MSEQRTRINEYLLRFGKEREIDLDPLNDAGLGQVARGSAEVLIQVLEEHGVLLLLAPMMAVPEKDTEGFFRRLLELSLMATSDAAFALDKKTGTTYLRIVRRLEGIDYEEFEDLLHTIASVADEWDDKLRLEFA